MPAPMDLKFVRRAARRGIRVRLIAGMSLLIIGAVYWFWLADVGLAAVSVVMGCLALLDAALISWGVRHGTYGSNALEMAEILESNAKHEGSS